MSRWRDDGRALEEACVRVRRWRSSGQTPAEYCAWHGLNVHTFDSWHRKAKASVTLVPMTVRDEARAVPSLAGTAIVLTCGNGMRVELGASVSAGWLVEGACPKFCVQSEGKDCGL